MRSQLMGKPSRGFTLPELVIVVAIIAILIAIVMILVTRERDNANVASCEQNERAIAFALESYSVDHSGQFPQYQGLVTSQMFGGHGNPYFDKDDLVDPASGLAYQYTSGPGTCADPDSEYQIIDQGGHSSPSLIALLEGDDGQDAVAFCSSRGLYALQYQGTAGGVSQQPDNPQSSK